jgi:hypothetical protein
MKRHIKGNYKTNNYLYDEIVYYKIEYTEPISKDMIILIPYFNPCNSINMFNNVKKVKKSLDNSKIPYYIGEVLFENQDSININNDENIFTYKTDNYMFYKENIINILLDKIITSQYTKICIMDADIMFQNKIWYDIISSSLNNLTICQPFNETIWLDKKCRCTHKKKSIIEIQTGSDRGHPGFIWAFTKEWLLKNKLFELCIIGGGDTLFASSILNLNLSDNKSWLNESYYNHLKKIDCPTKIGNIKLSVFHLYHGDINNRQYKSRNQLMLDLLSSYNLTDVSQLLEKNEDGLLKWKEQYKHKCNEVLLTFFENRKDDE